VTGDASHPPRRGRRRRFLVAGAVLVSLCTAGVMGVVHSARRGEEDQRRAVEDVRAAYQRGDCVAVAVGLHRVDRGPDRDAARDLRPVRVACDEFTAFLRTASGPLNASVRSYAAYVLTRSGPLVPAATARIAARMTARSPERLADARLCASTAVIVSTIAPATGLPDFAPRFLTACGDLHLREHRLDQALHAYTQAAREHPRSAASPGAVTRRARLHLLRSRLKEPAGVVAPRLVRRDPALKGRVRLLVENRVPQPLVVVTDGARQSVADVEGCYGCAWYGTPDEVGCGGKGSERAEVVVRAGRMTVLISEVSTGEGSLRGSWTPRAGGVYSVCVWEGGGPRLRADGR